MCICNPVLQEAGNSFCGGFVLHSSYSLYSAQEQEEYISNLSKGGFPRHERLGRRVFSVGSVGLDSYV